MVDELAAVMGADVGAAGGDGRFRHAGSPIQSEKRRPEMRS